MAHDILIPSLQVCNKRDFETALKFVGAINYFSTLVVDGIYLNAYLRRRKSIILPSEVSAKQQT